MGDSHIGALRVVDIEDVQACNLCGCSERKVLHHGLDLWRGHEGFRIVQCPRCGLVYTDPRPIPAAIGAWYPEDYAPFEGMFGDTLVGRMGDRLVRHDAKGMRIYRDHNTAFEVGCGNGDLLAALRDDGWAVAGVDISSHAVEVAEKKHGLIIGRGSLLDTHYRDEFFDVVIMKHALEHAHDPLATLKEAFRILRPGGALIIWVPKLGSIEDKIFGRYWYLFNIPLHLYHFSRESLRRYLEEAGFRVAAVELGRVPNSLVASCKIVLHEKFGRPLDSHFGVNSLMWMVPFAPISIILSLLGQSGRMKVIAEKPW